MSSATSQRDERRRSTRFKANLNCEVVATNGSPDPTTFTGIILDVSNTGARLMCPNSVDVGMELVIRLKRANTFPLQGKVVRKISSFAGQAIVGIRLTQGMFPSEVLSEAKEPTRYNDYPEDIHLSNSSSSTGSRSSSSEKSASPSVETPSGPTADSIAKDKEAAFIERLMGKRKVTGSAPPPVQNAGRSATSGQGSRPPGVPGSSGTARQSGAGRTTSSNSEDESFANFERKYGFKPDPEVQARRSDRPTERGRTRADSGRRQRPRDLAPKPDRNLPACLMKLTLTLPCTVEEVKRAYRIRAKMVHPDMGGSVEAFIALYQTYREALLFLETEANAGN